MNKLGSIITLSVGGKSDKLHGDPIEITGRLQVILKENLKIMEGLMEEENILMREIQYQFRLRMRIH